jgi:hypothetical protein
MQPAWAVFYFGDRGLLRTYFALARRAASVARETDPQLRAWFTKLYENVPGDDEQAAGVWLPLTSVLLYAASDSTALYCKKWEWSPPSPLLRPWSGGTTSLTRFRLLWSFRDIYTLSYNALLCRFAEPPRPKPQWNKDNKVLYYTGIVCRTFKRLKSNIVNVLDDFEAQGWPETVVVPGRTSPKDLAESLNSRLTPQSPIIFRHSHGRIGWGLKSP